MHALTCVLLQARADSRFVCSRQGCCLYLCCLSWCSQCQWQSCTIMSCGVAGDGTVPIAAHTIGVQCNQNVWSKPIPVSCLLQTQLQECILWHALSQPFSKAPHSSAFDPPLSSLSYIIIQVTGTTAPAAEARLPYVPVLSMRLGEFALHLLQTNVVLEHTTKHFQRALNFLQCNPQRIQPSGTQWHCSSAVYIREHITNVQTTIPV